MKTILVPVDLSTTAQTVCEAACDLAKPLDGRLALLHVVQPPPVMVTEVYALDTGQAEEMLTAAEQTGAARLRELAGRCEARGVKVTTQLKVGQPVTEILGRAGEADYLVMGSHGHGAVYDLLVGSTTHGVLRKAPCPVIIVPPAKRPAA